MARGKKTLRIRMKGGKECASALRQYAHTFDKPAARERLQSALVRASEPMAEAMRAFAPVKTGMFAARHIVVSRDLDGKLLARAPVPNGTVRVYVGERADVKPLGLMLEWGTGPRFHKKTGKYVGRMPPQPWARPGYSATAAFVLSRLIGFIHKELEESAKAAGSTANRAA